MENDNKQGVQNMKAWMKKHPIITVILGIVVLIFIINMFGGSSDKKTETSQVTQQQAEKPTVSKEQAQKDLTDFMETAKKAKLVSSYEFSDKATEIFIDSAWYTQKVEFKKDFIAKIGILKKTLTGYSHFVAKDAYTNEKVAEITAFSQSIEVYK